MAVEDDIRKFLALGSVAVVGASRDRAKYGNIVYRELRARGIRIFAVNPNAGSIEGDPSYPSLVALPAGVAGAVIVVPPAETERAVRDAAAAGIGSIWMQPGAESLDAVRFCAQRGLCAVHNACILVALRRAPSAGGLDA